VKLSSPRLVDIALMKRRLTSISAQARQWLMRSIGSRLTGDRHRFRVWLVDDREQNRTDFYDAQKHHFDIETFSTTGELLDALKSGVPDALLCDIYFYEDPVQREQIEQWVQEQASKLREEASTIAPDTAQRGIRLIGDIHKQFRGSPPFLSMPTRRKALIFSKATAFSGSKNSRLGGYLRVGSTRLTCGTGSTPTFGSSATNTTCASGSGRERSEPASLAQSSVFSSTGS